MEDICRLCCSTSFVNNNIFDEENALYLKMSLYLPIKVFKNDRLPQKVCDKCSCKVNDFYQFCNETIEIQDRLRSLLISSGVATDEIVDLTRIKENVSPVPSSKFDQATQTEWTEPVSEKNPTTLHNTDMSNTDKIQIKEEPQPLSPVKEEETDGVDFDNGFSDNSDDISLITLKKKKKKELNGLKKKPEKKKAKLKNWEIIMNTLPEGTAVSIVNPDHIKTDVKEEMEVKPLLGVSVDMKPVKSELGELELYNCCICFMQCFTRNEILHHYKQHALETPQPAESPEAPPPPDIDPLRCTRCRKTLARGEWAAHWARHWERDRRPFRCALCEKSYRDAHQILKHGQTHKIGSGEEDAEPIKKRFFCDLCPEGFVYMRYLLAHRTRAHPEALSRALVLRCNVCARQFAHLNSLRRHLRAHSGERNYLCNVCGKALSSREHLKFHIRIHTGYKPNVCKTCGKGFVKKCNLTLHERVHSGEKPHVCSHCGKAFSQRSTLVIHERYHSGARPYACALCGKGFVAKGLLSMHLKSTCICCPTRPSEMSTAVDSVRATRVNGHGPVNGASETNGAPETNGAAKTNGAPETKGAPETNGAPKTNGAPEIKGVPQTNGVSGTNEVNGDTAWEEQFLPLPLRIDDKIRAQKVESRLSSMVLCGATLRRVAEVFEEEMMRGLREEPSSLQMENTYVPELPDGTEEGVFLALDLGGTNFRVLLLELKAGQLVREDVKHYHISDALRIGSGDDLFNFLADCVLDFLKTEGMENDEFSLGFTFSFPMKQHSISSGELITWTKSFKCGGLAGVDVAALLQRCLRARGLRVTVRVLLNDTTGTLVAGAMMQKHVGIGVILGTGSNGCYMERAARVSHWEAAHDRVQDVCVDVEWGAFGDNGCIDFIKTDIDREVDAKSLLVRSFTFEKCIGGKYLGSVLSISLAALARDGLFPAAPKHDALETAHLSLFEEENCVGATSGTIAVLSRACPGVEFSETDALVAQHVAQVVSSRAAQLVSVCISTLLRRMERPFVAVAVDGSVYKRHPRISSLMNKYIRLLAPDCPFSLLPAEDGSGKGSALTAAIAARIASRDS